MNLWYLLKDSFVDMFDEMKITALDFWVTPSPCTTTKNNHIMDIFWILLTHLSRRLQWHFLIKICPLSVIVDVVVVVIVVVGVVVNFSHFHIFIFFLACHKTSLGERNLSLFKWRTPFFKVSLWRNIENKLTNLNKF